MPPLHCGQETSTPQNVDSRVASGPAPAGLRRTGAPVRLRDVAGGAAGSASWAPSGAVVVGSDCVPRAGAASDHGASAISVPVPTASAATMAAPRSLVVVRRPGAGAEGMTGSSLLGRGESGRCVHRRREHLARLLPLNVLTAQLPSLPRASCPRGR